MFQRFVEFLAPRIEASGSVPDMQADQVASVAARVCQELAWEQRETAREAALARIPGATFGDGRHVPAAFSRDADADLYKMFKAHVQFSFSPEENAMRICVWERAILPSPSERKAMRAAFEFHLGRALEAASA